MKIHTQQQKPQVGVCSGEKTQLVKVQIMQQKPCQLQHKT